MIIDGINIKVLSRNGAIVWTEESGLPYPTEWSVVPMQGVQITKPLSEIAAIVQVAKQEGDCTHNTRTKLERAKIIFAANAGATRKAIIAMFISQLQMTEAGASTYYATCKRTLN